MAKEVFTEEETCELSAEVVEGGCHAYVQWEHSRVNRTFGYIVHLVGEEPFDSVIAKDSAKERRVGDAGQDTSGLFRFMKVTLKILLF